MYNLSTDYERLWELIMAGENILDAGMAADMAVRFSFFKDRKARA